MDDRRTSERIAICVPTWSIETWALHLLGTITVVETESYKGVYEGDETRGSVSIKSAVKNWLAREDACNLPSCADARAELRRLGTEDD